MVVVTIIMAVAVAMAMAVTTVVVVRVVGATIAVAGLDTSEDESGSEGKLHC